MKKLKKLFRTEAEILADDQILIARRIQAKLKATNRKMIDKSMSYRMRLSAMLACDSRLGQCWAV